MSESKKTVHTLSFLLRTRFLVVLDQRRERRRARAIIVKDRSKITAPSDTVVKANKKARKENDALGPSKYRTATDAVDRHAKVKHTKRRKGNRRRSESTSSMSDNDTDHKAIKYQITSTKRSTDVQRNVAALKEASKGKRPGNKTAKYDPLERAANILPAGRVTVRR